MSLSLAVSVVALIIALISTACGQVFYKAYFVFSSRIYVYLAIGFFLIAPMMSYVALKNLTIDAVYISTGLTHVIVIMLAHCWLNERITRPHLQGIALVICGLVIYAI